MPAYNFSAQFADAVASGVKCQTIRRRRKRRTQSGETLYLYTGMRTQHCRLLAQVRCRAVVSVHLDGDYVRLGTGELIDRPDALDAFARADGFECWRHMLDWFEDLYGLPFDGELIRWGDKRWFLGGADW